MHYINIQEILATLLILSICYFLVSIISIQKKKVSIDEYKTYCMPDLETNLMNNLSDFIAHVFNDYVNSKVLYNPEFKYNPNSTEHDMAIDVKNEVINKMSPAMLNQLCKIYNKYQIPVVLSSIIYPLVSSYLSDYINRAKEE